ncbi:unnamed protein product [Trichobilharzia regenti]|nr:unnamed protein product [Trichobilharzia regenti]
MKSSRTAVEACNKIWVLLGMKLVGGLIRKVFERSVDFGQFSENAALYPMARAWIRNLNQGDSSSWNDVPSMDDDQENNDQLPDCHYALPKPSDGFTDNEIRIPPPLPSEGQPFLINIEVIVAIHANCFKNLESAKGDVT